MIGRTLAGRAAIRTVEAALQLASGAGFYRHLGLERLFRDVQGARYHPLRESAQVTYTGRVALGVDVNGFDSVRKRRKGVNDMKMLNRLIGLVAVVILVAAQGAQADIVTDANARAAEMVSRVPAPPSRSSRPPARPPAAIPRSGPSSPRPRGPRWRQRSRRRRAPRSPS
jgi:hypothetical protein